MKLLRRVMLWVAVMCGGVAAQASVQPSVLDTNDSGCVEDGSTAGCFSDTGPTPTAYSGPTVTKCRAISKEKQRCRSCEDARYDNGQPKGYKICAYVGYHAHCSCKSAGTPNCQDVGDCEWGY